MSKIMISELVETTTAPDESYIAIDNGSATNKITIANYNANANHTAKRYADAAEGYADNAIAARDSAISAKNECETFVNSASNFANAASTNASAAAGSASEASGYVGSAQASASNALASARAADNSAADAANQVLQSKSWAQGNTGVRAGENTNNAKYWSEVARGAAGGGVSTFNGRFGAVLPESGDYSSDQIAHVNSDSTYSNVETAINNLQTYVGSIQTDVERLDVDKLDKYDSDSTQWDSTPTANSTKPVTSGGVKTQFNAVTNEFTDVNNILGAKNMCPNNASTTTQSGVTYTVNSNGSVKITGTATANSTIVLGYVTLPKGKYKLTTGQTTESGATQFLYAQEWNNGTWGNTLGRSNDSSGGALGEFTLSADKTVGFLIGCNNGRTGTVTLYPMCRPANIRNASYVPYAPTNRQLDLQIKNADFEYVGLISISQTVNLDHTKNYKGLVSDNGTQYYFIQFGGAVFSAQVILKNGSFAIGYKINYGSNWSDYGWVFSWQ